MAKDPVTQLLEFMIEPDTDSWRKFGDYLPYLFVRSDNHARSEVAATASAAISALDGQDPFPAGGSQRCWSYTDGCVSLTAGAHTMADPPRAVLAVDDRDDRIASHDGRAWKEWLRLSNWLGFSDRHRISTYSRLSVAPLTGAVDSQIADLPDEWLALLEDAVSDAERDLIRALAESGVTVPVLGYETDGGDVIDLAWAQARVGVSFDGEDTADGWTLCPADVAHIVAALKSNGVM